MNKPTVIGMTGSVGKSSERDAVRALLQDNFRIRVIEKGNSETGVPLGILGLQVHSLGFETLGSSIFDWIRLVFSAPFSLGYLKNIQYLIVEMGIDDPYPPRNMGYMLSIVKPDISVFLNVYPVHTEQFEKTLIDTDKEALNSTEKRIDEILKNIAKEKGRIITDSQCKVGIYNFDNRYVKEAVAHVAEKSQIKLISFGSDESNDVYYGRYEVAIEGTMFTFYINNEGKKESILLKINNYALPEEYREIFAAAIAVGKNVGMSNFQITQSLQKNFSVPPSRASLLKGLRNSIILDSSYNASRSAVQAFIRLGSVLAKKEKHPFVFLFGDMRELGNEAKNEHEAVAQDIIKAVDYLYCVGPLTKEYILPVVKQEETASKLREIKWFATSSEAGEYLKDNIPEGALILVKGSQNTIFMEEAVKALLQNKNDVSKLCRQENYWLQKKGFDPSLLF